VDTGETVDISRNRARAPIFGVASWILPLVVVLLTPPVMEHVKARAVVEAKASAKGFAGSLADSLIAGIGAELDVIVGATVVSLVLAFGCGVIAPIRRERYWILSLVPRVIGAAGLVVYVVCVVLHAAGVGRPAP
jgi:hypothetical protein